MAFCCSFIIIIFTGICQAQNFAELLNILPSGTAGSQSNLFPGGQVAKFIAENPALVNFIAQNPSVLKNVPSSTINSFINGNQNLGTNWQNPNAFLHPINSRKGVIPVKQNQFQTPYDPYKAGYRPINPQNRLNTNISLDQLFKKPNGPIPVKVPAFPSNKFNRFSPQQNTNIGAANGQNHNLIPFGRNNRTGSTYNGRRIPLTPINRPPQIPVQPIHAKVNRPILPTPGINPNTISETLFPALGLRPAEPVGQYPNFGRYCGTLAENATPGKTKYYNCRGTVWVMDPQTLIVSKFTFQPSFYEIGPAKKTKDSVADMFPSENGMFLKPKKLEIKPPAFKGLTERKVLIARRPTTEQVLSIFGPKKNESSSAEPTPSGEPIADAEPSSSLSKPEPVPVAEGSRRKRKAAFRELWPDNTNTRIERTGQSIKLIVDGGEVEVQPSNLVHFNTDQSIDSTPNLTPKLPSRKLFGPNRYEVQPFLTDQTPPILPARKATTATPTTTTTVTVATTTKPESKIEPLTWYAGFQPIKLKVPDGYDIKKLHWLSVWDHKNKKSIASVLIPNGPGFKIPAPTKVRGLQSAGIRRIGSGPIEIVDEKTIKIHEFFFEGDAPGAWFMVGKNVFPNALGTIVPIIKNGNYSCEFLYPYEKETVTLELPGDMTIKDVFWLSVFCIPYSISFAHVYLPYNDLYVPPAKSGLIVPHCVLES